jgi:hypothetical protein
MVIFNVVLLGIVLLAGSHAQPNPQPLKPVTVCEILMNQEKYNGTNVAAIGRSSQTSEGHWLMEDKCDRNYETNGFVWENIIWVQCCSQPAPDPSSGSLLLDEAALIEKLAQLRKSTKLQMISRQSYRVTDGKSAGRVNIKDTWAVVYGRIDARKNLRTYSIGKNQVRGIGYGQIGAAPAQIVTNETSMRFIKDEEYPSSTAKK